MEFKSVPGVKMPVLGIGTWTGSWNEREGPRNDSERLRCLNSIKIAIEKGITHIDTAELYGTGKAEEIIGEAIKGIDRNALFITSKVLGSRHDYGSVIRAAKRTLARLGTEYLDLYLVHWFNPNMDLKAVMKAMDDLVDQGLVKHIGLSNFSVEQMKKAQECAQNRIVNNQVEYNVLTQNNAKRVPNVKDELLPYCQQNDILLTAYKPLSIRRRGNIATLDVPVLSEIAQKYDKTPAQIAINWLISQKNVITIPTMTSPEHIDDNLGALGWKLDADDMEKLNYL